MYISTPSSPEVENFQMKIYDVAGDWTLDPLDQRQTCYHLSQRSGLMEEVEITIKEMKNGKATGVDGIPIELVKCLGEEKKTKSVLMEQDL